MSSYRSLRPPYKALLVKMLQKRIVQNPFSRPKTGDFQVVQVRERCIKTNTKPFLVHFCLRTDADSQSRYAASFFFFYPGQAHRDGTKWWRLRNFLLWGDKRAGGTSEAFASSLSGRTFKQAGSIWSALENYKTEIRLGLKVKKGKKKKCLRFLFEVSSSPILPFFFQGLSRAFQLR